MFLPGCGDYQPVVDAAYSGVAIIGEIEVRETNLIVLGWRSSEILAMPAHPPFFPLDGSRCNTRDPNVDPCAHVRGVFFIDLLVATDKGLNPAIV